MRTDPLIERQRQRGTQAKIVNLREQIRHTMTRRANAQAGAEQCSEDLRRVQTELDRIRSIGAAKVAEVEECSTLLELMSAQVEQLAALEELAVADDERDQATADLAAAQADVTRRRADLKTLTRAHKALV